MASLLVGVVVALVSQFITLPYFVFSPGDARAVGDYVEVPNDKAFPPKGEVLLTTVSVVRAHPFDIVWAWITPNSTIHEQEEILGDATPSQFFEANELSMEESKMTATYVAMRRAGFDVRLRGEGATIVAVSPNSPASGKLQPGETIVGVGSQPVELATAVGDSIRPLTPGATVVLEVLNAAGVKRSVDLTVAAHPGNESISFVGVNLKTKAPRLDAPFSVELKTEKIGGPSAGLAFALSALDRLTPGELTGGIQVATTGTIDVDGSVGQVGGVEQKVAAVNDSDAKLFLVPTAEVDDAKRHARKSLKVVGVDDLDDALAALRDSGGDISGLSTPPY